MKKIIFIIMAAMIFAACKDPNVGPNDDQNPKDNAGFIQFESPAVGQKSSYLHFYAKGYYEPTPMPLSYTKDTIHWEITKQIDKNIYQITERLVGSYFGNAAIDRVMRYITLIKETDRVLLVTERTTGSPLVGYGDTLELPIDNARNVPFMDWRVGGMNSTAAFDGYVSNYKVNDKEYDKLDVYSDFTPTHHDGFGLLFAYNSGYGMVRHYAMNPWVGDVNGFDLITDMKKRTDGLTDLAGTNWRLKNVVYNDGSVKSIEEIFWGDRNISKDPNFTMFINSETGFGGFAGCNEYGGEYSLNKETINIENVISTYVACKFTSEYTMSLSNSTTYNSDGETLIINTSFENIKSLVFERITDTVEEFPLIGTKWKLRTVHYPNRKVIPIEELLGKNGSNNAFNQFILEFVVDDIISGFAGCNTFGGTYKFNQPEIKMEVGNITQMACEFSGEYSKILNAAYKLDASPDKLTIYTRLDGYVALEFNRVR